MRIISTNRKGRNEYLVFSACQQVLFQVNVESTAAELPTAADALAYISTTGMKACVRKKGVSPVYRKRPSIRAKRIQASSKLFLEPLNASITVGNWKYLSHTMAM